MNKRKDNWKGKRVDNMNKFYLVILFLASCLSAFAQVDRNPKMDKPIQSLDLMKADGSFDLNKAVKAGYSPSQFFVQQTADGPKFYPKGQLLPLGSGKNYFQSATDADLNWEDQLNVYNSVDHAEVNAVGVNGNTVYVGGQFRIVDGQAMQYLAAYDINSGTWSAIPGLDGTVYSMKISGSDVYVGGDFWNPGSTGSAHIAKWNGTSWVGFGTGLSSTVHAIEVVGSRVFAGGYFQDAGGDTAADYIAEWDGSAWKNVGGGLNSSVEAFAMSPNNNYLYLGGDFTDAGGNTSADYIARIDITASPGSFENLGTGTTGGVRALHFDEYYNTYQLYVGGSFSSANSVASTSRLAIWNEFYATWYSLNATYGGVNDYITSISQSGYNLYFVGGFIQTELGGLLLKNIGSYNVSTGTYSALNASFANGKPYVIAATATSPGSNNEKVVVGGTFETIISTNYRRVALYDRNTDSFSAMGDGVRKGYPTISAIARIGDEIFVGGTFDEVAGQPTGNMASWNMLTNTWSTYDLSSGTVSAFATDGSVLYVGGWFISAGGNADATRIAVYDPVTTIWSGLGTGGGSGGANSGVYAIELAGSDIYIGGYFGIVNGVSANQIARYTAGGWVDIGGADGLVDRLAYDDVNAKLYVGGYFANVGGTYAPYLASYSTSTGWANFATVTGGRPNAMMAYNGDLYIGGYFSLDGGSSYPNFSMWNGSFWSNPIPNINGQVQSIALLGDEFVLGGYFYSDANIPDDNLMKWNPSTGVLSSFGNGTYGTVWHIFIDQDDNVLVAGDFEQVGNNTDSYKMGIWYTPFIQTSIPSLPASFCAGTNLNVAYTVSGSFDANNVFTAQLSDASGSFANPVDIGNVSSTTDGNIATVIPSSTAYGSGYLIRVVSSNPSVTATVADNGTPLNIGCTINDYYWVGGSGDWSDYANHWATTSGGASFYTSVPSSLDNVHFDDQSFTADGQSITLNATGNAYNIDWTNIPYSVSIVNYWPINVDGSVVLDPNVTYQVYFDMNGNQSRTITSNGAVVDGGISVFGSGSVSLVDGLNSGLFIYNNGTFDFNDQTFQSYDFEVYNTPSVYLGASTLYLTNYYYHGGGGILDPGTSVIYHSGRYFYGGNLTYNDMIVQPGNYATLNIYDNNTFANLTLDPGASVTLSNGTTQTATGFSVTGTKADPITIQSDSPGLQATISVATGTIDGDWLFIRDNAATGGATFNANNSLDNGNNTGWNFTAPIPNEYYWVGGAGNWSDYANHWATTSGGTTFYTQAPSSFDNVTFDVNSFTMADEQVFLDVDAYCNDFTATGLTYTSNFGGNYDLNIYGSASMDPNLTINRYIYMWSSGSATYAANGSPINWSLRFYGGGSYSLASDIDGNSMQVYNSSQLDLLNYNVNLSYLNAYNNSSLFLNGATITIDGGLGIYTSGVFDPGTGTITQTGGYLDGYGNSFNSYTVGKSAYPVTIYASNTFNTLTFAPGSKPRLKSGTTQTATTLVATGTRTDVIILDADTPANQATISVASGTVNGDYLIIQDNAVIGGATFNANNSVDNGNNTGWVFTAPTYADLYWVGGAGDWSDYANHWATSSGGATFSTAAPSPFDHVHFDLNSFTGNNQIVNLTEDANAASITSSGITNYGTMIDGYYNIGVYGSMDLTGFKRANAYFVFWSTAIGNTITTGGSWTEGLNFQGTGEYSLTDDVNGSSLNMDKGSLNTNGYAVSLYGFYTNSNSTLTLGSSIINANYFSGYAGTLDAGTSTINMKAGYFDGADKTYYDVNLIDFNGGTYIYGNNTFNTLTLLPGVTARFHDSHTQTIASMVATGTQNGTIGIMSSNNGSQGTISAASGTINGEWLVIQDNNATGGATFNANNSVDNGNNTGWNFTAPSVNDYYWVGGSGNLSDVSHWATSSGGSSFYASPPSSTDNVFFDSNSFSANGETITLDVSASIHNLDMSGVLYNFNFVGGNDLEITGSAWLSSLGVYQNNITFNSPGPETITSNGAFIENSLTFAGSGTLTINDQLNADYLQIISGTTHFNYQTSYLSTFDISGTANVYFDWGNFYINGSFANTTSGYFQGNSYINFTGYTFDGGGQTYADIQIGWPNSTAIITGDNHFSSISIPQGGHVSFGSGYTQYADYFYATGSKTDLITIDSDSPGNQGTISVASGTVDGSWLQIIDNNATGGATFNANNSVDAGNNSGWNFTAPASSDYYWVGGTGNWSDLNHWSNASGGASYAYGNAPTRFDNVYFDDLSFPSGGAVTLDLTTNQCLNMDWSGVTNSPTIKSLSSSTLEIYGNFIMDASVRKDLGLVDFLGFDTSVGNDIYSGGTTWGNSSSIEFKGVGIFNNYDELIANTIRFYAGTFYSNDYDLTSTGFRIESTYSPTTLELGFSIITTSFFRNFSGTSPNGSYTINVYSSSSGGLFFGGDLAYNDLTLQGSVLVRGNNTFNNFIINEGSEITLENSTVQTAGSFEIYGTRSNPIIIKSDLSGSPAGLDDPSGNLTADYAFIKDNTAVSGGYATSSVDLGGNTNWTFGSTIIPQDYYWAGGSGNWSDVSHWASNSNLDAFYTEAPGPLDNVYFVGGSFDAENQSITVDQDAYCYDFNWTNVIAPNGSLPALKAATGTKLNVFGSMYLSSNMQVDPIDIVFKTNGNKEIYHNGANIENARFTFDGSGIWGIGETLNLDYVELKHGTLNTNDNSINTRNFVISGGDTKTLNLGYTSITTWYWQYTGSNCALDAVNSSIYISIPGSGTGYFIGGFNGEQYGYVNFANTVRTIGSLDITQLAIQSGADVQLQAGSTINLLSLDANGTEDNVIYIHSDTDGSQGNFSATSGTITASYVHLKDNNATGGATFTATSSSDLGNVTGWTGLLQSQDITFDPFNDVAYGGTINLSATSGSGNQVTFTLLDGDATLNSNTLNINGPGLVGIKAFQSGGTLYAPAKPVKQYFYAYNQAYELGNFKEANVIVGQVDGTSQDLVSSQTVFPAASSAAVSSTGQMAVACFDMGRVLIYNTVPGSSGTSADVILGKPDFNSTASSTSDRDMEYSRWVAFSPDGSKLLVSDLNRILIWNSIPTSNYTPADIVLGQADFFSNTSGISDSQFNEIWGIEVTSDGKLMVADAGNNRVLIYNSIPTDGTAVPDIVIGAPDFNTDNVGTSETQLNHPEDMTLADDGVLYIADFGNNRIMSYSTIPTANGAAADIQFGQDDIYSSAIVDPDQYHFNGPSSIDSYNGEYIAVSDYYNSRVLIYDINFNPAFILGQPDYNSNEPFFGGVSARSIRAPLNVEFDGAGNVLVSGRYMNRVMFYGLPDTTVPQINVPGLSYYTLNNTSSLSVTITDDRNVANVNLILTGISDPTTSRVQMDNFGGTTYSYDLSYLDNSNEQLGIKYQVEATDGYGNMATSPESYTNLSTSGNSRLSQVSSSELPIGSAEANYRIIAMPLVLDNNGLTTVFDEFGTIDKAEWRMWRLDKSASDFGEMSSSDQLGLGEGYFLLKKTAPSGTVDLGPGSVPQVNDASPYTIDLSDGWNMIGNPYNFTVNWSDVMSASGDPTNLNVYDYNGTWNSSVSTLPRFRGLLIYANGATTITFPTTNTNKIDKGKDFPSKLLKGTTSNWEIDFQLETAGITSNLSGIGMRQNAEQSFDHFDILTPPRFQSYLEMNTTHNEFQVSRFSKDVVPVQDNYMWIFNLETNLISDKITIKWDSSVFDPGPKQLILYDPIENVAINMRETGRYTYNYSDTRTLQVLYGYPEFIQDNLHPIAESINVYPNPFTSETTISFGIPGNAQTKNRVVFELYDSMGQKVTTFGEGVYNSGYHTIKMDRNLSENLSKAGLYILKMSISGDSGTFTKSIRIVAL